MIASRTIDVTAASPGTTGEWHDYDYAIVRVVPEVHRTAFVNIGVVLHSRTAGALIARVVVDVERLERLCPGLDTTMLRRHVEAYLRVVRGGDEAAPLGLLPPSERFHWLTAPRSAVLQTSEVHPGRAHDLDAELERLYQEQVAG